MHTCAAVSTAPGKAGISVIRLSGDDSFDIASRVFFPASGKPLSAVGANMQVFGRIFGTDGKEIDSGMCTCFYAPHSYTGENTVEISCHGSPVGTSLVLAAVLENGAKPALAGEFTKRAFVNGKLGLTQAEAVGQLIDAKSAASLRLSSSQLSGSVGSKLKQTADEITTLLASVYAYIDYPDEDMTDIPKEELKKRLCSIKHELDSLCGTYSTGLAINDGVPCAIVGNPNTGKSSLMNMLAGFDRAIVTQIAGTTRDVVSENVSVGNILLKLSDTAGIRITQDEVEKIGVERSLGELEKSSLVMAVFDVSKPFEENTNSMTERLKTFKDKDIIIVLNKCDMCSPDEYKEKFEKLGFCNIACISAKNGTGRQELEKAVCRIYPESQDIESGIILTNARQFASVKCAADSVDKAIKTLDVLTPDMALLDMEQALGALLEADGRKVSEEIVNSIFSHFCVGK